MSMKNSINKNFLWSREIVVSSRRWYFKYILNYFNFKHTYATYVAQLQNDVCWPL